MATIALDMMGGDVGPAATVPGAVQAAAAGIDVVLVGDAKALDGNLAAEVQRAGLRVVDAPEAVSMDERATRGVRGGARTPLYASAELIRSGEAHAMVSMGNTGAAVATALRVLGRLPGVERPALAVVVPTSPVGTLFLDAGANASVRPGHLVQFAQLGSAYMHAVKDIANPRVALLSIGEEPSKGDAVTVEAHRALVASELNFIGNLESRRLLYEHADVVVTDGFTGNISVKLIEGVAARLFEQMQGAASRSLRARIGAALLLPSLRELRSQLSARHHGAAPLLGVNGGVFIGHGSSDAGTVARSVEVASDAIERGMLEAFSAAVAQPPQVVLSD